MTSPACVNRGIKRARQDDQGTLDGLMHQEGLWFADGNIVIIAESVAFRVHKSMLAAKSPVFKDTFTLDQPADIEMYEGCEVLRLPDSAQDLRIMIEAMYSGLRHHARPTSWDLVRSLLLMGHKYDIDEAYQEGLESLNIYAPTTIAALDESIGHPLRRRDANHAISVANLARTLELPRIHALALYDCVCRLSASNLLRGKGETLSTDDLEKCINGKHNLLDMWYRIMRASFTGHPIACTTTDSCTRLKGDGLDMVLEVGFEWEDCYKVLDPLLEDVMGFMTENGLCNICSQFIVESYDRERQNVLDNLLEMFSDD